MDISSTTTAQIWVDGVDVNQETDIQYMSIRLVNRFLEVDQVLVLVDYGQANCTRRALRDSCRMLERKYGENKVFVSEAAVLNYFYAQGWRMKETFYRDGGDTDLTIQFLLERM